MTKHKQAKALHRGKQKRKEVKQHRHSFRGKNPLSNMTHPKPLGKEDILAQRKPIESEEEVKKE